MAHGHLPPPTTSCPEHEDEDEDEDEIEHEDDIPARSLITDY
jgi:hypothetical protein